MSQYVYSQSIIVDHFCGEYAMIARNWPATLDFADCKLFFFFLSPPVLVGFYMQVFSLNIDFDSSFETLSNLIF